MLVFSDIPSEMSGESEKLPKEVIIIIALVVPAVVFVLLLCIFHRRRKAKEAQLHSVHYEDGKDDTGVKKDRLSNVVSMRDRIREWKVAPSELTELVDICKSRGVLDIPVDNIGKVEYKILLTFRNIFPFCLPFTSVLNVFSIYVMMTLSGIKHFNCLLGS